VDKELIIRSGSSYVDFALLRDGRLIELHKEEDTNGLGVGDIMLGSNYPSPSLLPQNDANILENTEKILENGCRF